MPSRDWTRREYLAMLGAGAVGTVIAAKTAAAGEPAREPLAGTSSHRQSSAGSRLRIGMCDWSMGRQDVSAFELARKIGLDGLQVSVGKPDNLYLRDPQVQQKYVAAAKETGVAIASTAMALLNVVPFMSEPKTALWTADCIEATRNIGSDIMLLAFFSAGELREESKEDMRRTTETLKELAPRAEKAGVVLGLETYLRAEAHLQILDAVGSDAVQVYYDVYNSHVTKGYDFTKEIRMIGARRICQVHLKEGRSLLGESGKVNWPAVADVLREVGYKGWLILETTSPSGNVVDDTKRNLDYVRKTFAGLV